MNNLIQKSCTVSFPIEGNHATSFPHNATDVETNDETIDLLALSIRVLERNKRNYQGNIVATHKLPKANSDSTNLINILNNQINDIANRSSNPVRCIDCESFIPDQIGSIAGIGSCLSGIKFTNEFCGQWPLYAFSTRRCYQFNNK